MKEIIVDLLIVVFFVAVSAGVNHRFSAQDSCKGHSHGAHAQSSR